MLISKRLRVISQRLRNFCCMVTCVIVIVYVKDQPSTCFVYERHVCRLRTIWRTSTLYISHSTKNMKTVYVFQQELLRTIISLCTKIVRITVNNMHSLVSTYLGAPSPRLWSHLKRCTFFFWGIPHWWRFQMRLTAPKLQLFPSTCWIFDTLEIFRVLFRTNDWNNACWT